MEGSGGSCEMVVWERGVNGKRLLSAHLGCRMNFCLAGCYEVL